MARIKGATKNAPRETYDPRNIREESERHMMALKSRCPLFQDAEEVL